MVWNSVATVGLLCGLLGVLLGVVIFWTRPDRTQNRTLAVFFVGAGVYQFLWHGVRVLWTEADVVWDTGVVSYTLLILTQYAYVRFLSTLDAPFLAPLRSRWGEALVGALFLGLAALVVVAPTSYLPSLVPFRHIGGYDYTVGPMREVFLLVLLCLWVAGALAAVSAYRRAPSHALRVQMRTYMVAFVVHDLLNVAWIAHRLMGQPWTSSYVDELIIMWVAPAAGIFLALTLAYGILKNQLFDIDLKIKWTLHRGTAVALLTPAFFVAKEILEDLISLGSGVPGILAAGSVGILAWPVWLGTKTVVDRVIPGKADDADYITLRKEQVFRSAIEEALLDNELSARDHRLLEAMRGSLDIAPERGATILAEVEEAFRHRTATSAPGVGSVQARSA